jgi:TPR repeat protein
MCSYRYARGVPKDMKKAVDYLQRAADLGYSLAQNGLAVCVVALLCCSLAAWSPWS